MERATQPAKKIGNITKSKNTFFGFIAPSKR